MKLHVLGAGTARGKDLAKYASDGDFRKATRNMKMGYAAIEPILERFPKLQSASFVLGSSYGELEVTKTFLSTLEQQGVARPLLFQNSLHNATLGFLALKIGATGPSMTVSHRHFTGENCLEAASLLLAAGSSLCLALTVEARVPELEAGMTQNYPSEVLRDEGAAALLLASESAVRELGARSLAVIEAVDCQLEGGESLTGPYYDSDSLERIVNAIREGRFPRELRLSKPDRSLSVIRLTEG
jgi:hypothetical protein